MAIDHDLAGLAAVSDRPRTNRGNDRVARPVLWPWIVSRAIAVVTLTVFGARAARFIPDYTRLVTWDGNWYRIIATTGYGSAPRAGAWSTWPFFPLLPGLVWVMRQLGSRYTVALLAVSNLATLAALAGVRKAALLVTNERGARYAVWLTALFPGSITLVMAYPDSLYLAGAVWAFVLLTRGQPVWAGFAALVAAAARPNGALVLVALAVAVATTPRSGRGRRMVAVLGPSVVFLAGWCSWLWHATGNPFVFIAAKRAWAESTVLSIVRAPIEHRWALAHLLLGLLLAAPFAARWRRYPRAWQVHVLLALAPSLLLGLVGLARYAISCFPLAVAAGDLVARTTVHGRVNVPRWTLVASVAAFVGYGLLITTWSYVP